MTTRISFRLAWTIGARTIGAIKVTTVATLIVLGMLTVLTGCKAPGIEDGLRLPGSSLPTSNAHQPNLAVDPGDARQVSQVGFVDRMRAGVNGSCGSCRSCVQGGACGQACAPYQGVLANCGPIQLGRPVDPQEFICNGGDIPPAARVLRDDSIAGLQPQDAIAHYTTEAGDIEVIATNRVCLYAPRFGAIRQVSGAVAGEKAIGLNRTYLPVGPNGIGLVQPSLIVRDIDALAHADVARRIDAMRDRNRAVPVEGIIQPYVAEDALQILAVLDNIALNQLDVSQIAILQRGAIAARSWMVRDAVEVMIESVTPPVLIRDARVESFVEYDFPDAGRLQIMKVADRDHAQQGEQVTFAIHVRNVGDSPVHFVEIADNLVSRLEYVKDSQSCDREADFETNANAAGSVRMKWTLKEPLAVGDTAKIEFKCRVR